MWSLFFLIVTGRALENDDLSAEEYEKVFEFMYELSKTAPYGIKTTEAMHYRRYVAQRIKAEHGITQNENAKGVAWRTAGVSDGKGFVFVSHTGEIYPSGFLPLECGNVRHMDLGVVYREHPLLRVLREPDALGGKCGVCEFRHVCGGSRARAYAVTGDVLAQDPACAYIPRTWSQPEKGEAS